MGLNLGRFLIVFGVLLILAGILVSANLNIPFLGKLPGDIHVKRDNFQFYFPLATSILISVILTFLFYVFRR